MIRLVLIRHGESLWNKENRFTGWTDIDLTEKGITEAKTAGQRLLKGGYAFDLGYTSLLKRAIKTMDYALEEMDQLWIPVLKSWRLNERHYGALQGLNKADTAARFGEEQVHVWRRSFEVCPPPLLKDDPRYPGNDPRYIGLSENEIPLMESLKDTVERFLPYWGQTIVPSLKAGKKVLISAHGNSLRALVMHLDNVPADKIADLEIPTGVPLVYELDESLTPLGKFYLED